MKWGKGYEVGLNREIDLQARARRLVEEVRATKPPMPSPYCNCWSPRMHRDLCPNCSSMR